MWVQKRRKMKKRNVHDGVFKRRGKEREEEEEEGKIP